MLTGVWSVDGELGEEEAGATGEVPLQAAISFLSKVEPAPELAYVIEEQGESTVLVIDTSTGELTAIGEPPEGGEAFCGSGSFSNPQAEPGYLCVFPETVDELSLLDFEALVESAEGSPFASEAWVSPDPESGAIVPFTLKHPLTGTPKAGGYAKGSWALNTE